MHDCPETVGYLAIKLCVIKMEQHWLPKSALRTLVSVILLKGLQYCLFKKTTAGLLADGH